MIKDKSEHDKLQICMILLSAGIFLILLQIVFIQPLYRMSAEKTVKRAADRIAAYSRSEDLYEEIDRLSKENGLLVFVTEPDGTILYSSDSYKTFYHSYGNGDGGTSNPYIYDDVMEWQTGSYRKLPDGYGDFLISLRDHSSGKTEIRTDSKFIYGRYIELESGEQVILYAGVVLSTNHPALSMIRRQLFLSVILLLAMIGAAGSYLLKQISDSKSGPSA